MTDAWTHAGNSSTEQYSAAHAIGDLNLGSRGASDGREGKLQTARRILTRTQNILELPPICRSCASVPATAVETDEWSIGIVARGGRECRFHLQITELIHIPLRRRGRT